MKTHPFTRPTVVAAVELLAANLSQAKFDQVLVRLELDHEIPLGPGKSVTAKSALLASAVTRRSAQVINTLDGPMTIAEAAVRMAVQATMQDHEQAEQLRLLRGLALDGYVVSWNEGAREPMLRAALPGDVDLPACDDEVHQLLKQFEFAVPLGHMDQAIDAHACGDWAAANSQIRSFLEGLVGDIAQHIEPQLKGQSPSAENCRALLAERGFLSKDRNEWTADGKNFLNGLFKMLHTDGSHPGLSDENHSTFRQHVALITGRALLRRLNSRTWGREVAPRS